MKHVTHDEISTHVVKYNTRFSTEVFLKKPTFFLSNEDLLQKMNPREQWCNIGNGSFGSVFKAKWLGVDVAVKTCDEFISENPVLEDFIINSSIRHPNIVNFFVASPNFIVMELMKNGTLDDILINQKLNPPQINIRKKWCSQISMAVRYLHETGIVHSDIKPENILIGSNWEAKVCDVGGGYFINDEITDKIYTDMYLPLTLHIGDIQKDTGKETDMYSLSLIIMCILSWDSDIYSLLGIPHFERRICDKQISRSEMIRECLEICIPNAYNLIQSYNVSDDVKSFLFRIFSGPCKYHIKNQDVLNVIIQSEENSNHLDIGCLAEL